MEKEVKADWNKIPDLAKISTITAILAIIFVILSFLVGIWWDAFPTGKCFLTGLVIFLVSGWIIRVTVLDKNGDIEEKFRKEI